MRHLAGMQPISSTHSADTLTLLLRQRDLQPYLDETDRTNLGLVSKGVRAASVPLSQLPKTRRYAEMLARQCEPSPPHRPGVARRMLIHLATAALDGPDIASRLEDCRDLIWQADAAHRRNAPRAPHNTKILTSDQRRDALILLYASRWDMDRERATNWVNYVRQLDPQALMRLLANDGLALCTAGTGVAFGLGAASMAQRTGAATAKWWAVGGVCGTVGASVFGVVTGGLGLAAGGAAVFVVDVLAERVRGRKQERAAVPYSVATDLLLCSRYARRTFRRAP